MRHTALTLCGLVLFTASCATTRPAGVQEDRLPDCRTAVPTKSELAAMVMEELLEHPPVYQQMRADVDEPLAERLYSVTKEQGVEYGLNGYAISVLKGDDGTYVLRQRKGTESIDMYFQFLAGLFPGPVQAVDLLEGTSNVEIMLRGGSRKALGGIIRDVMNTLRLYDEMESAETAPEFERARVQMDAAADAVKENQYALARDFVDNEYLSQGFLVSATPQDM